MSKCKVNPGLYKSMLRTIDGVRSSIEVGRVDLALERLEAFKKAMDRLEEIGTPIPIDDELQVEYRILSAKVEYAQESADADGGHAQVNDGGDGEVAPMPQAAAPEPQAQMAAVELRPVEAGPQQRDYGAYQQQNASDDQQGYVALGGDEKSVCPCVIL